jgi:hypothetical protein
MNMAVTARRRSASIAPFRKIAWKRSASRVRSIARSKSALPGDRLSALSQRRRARLYRRCCAEMRASRSSSLGSEDSRPCNGEHIRRDLPAHSEVEVTLRIDESRIITVTAYGEVARFRYWLTVCLSPTCTRSGVTEIPSQSGCMTRAAGSRKRRQTA